MDSYINHTKGLIEQVKSRLKQDEKNLNLLNELKDLENELKDLENEQTIARHLHAQLLEYVKQNELYMKIGPVTAKNNFRVTIKDSLYSISFRGNANCCPTYEIALFNTNGKLHDEIEITGSNSLPELFVLFTSLLKFIKSK